MTEGLDEELDEAARQEREKMRAAFRPEDLAQYTIKGETGRIDTNGTFVVAPACTGNPACQKPTMLSFTRADHLQPLDCALKRPAAPVPSCCCRRRGGFCQGSWGRLAEPWRHGQHQEQRRCWQQQQDSSCGWRCLTVQEGRQETQTEAAGWRQQQQEAQEAVAVSRLQSFCLWSVACPCVHGQALCFTE